VSSPAVTRSLNRLVGLGLVSREPDPGDGRAWLLSLTSAGRREREALLRSREKWLSEHLTRLSPDEVQALLAALPALEKLCDPQLPPPGT
jgi:DNA-binding MarR family transcriptional regulator